jgi:hypothetical protein
MYRIFNNKFITTNYDKRNVRSEMLFDSQHNIATMRAPIEFWLCRCTMTIARRLIETTHIHMFLSIIN